MSAEDLAPGHIWARCFHRCSRYLADDRVRRCDSVYPSRDIRFYFAVPDGIAFHLGGRGICWRQESRHESVPPLQPAGVVGVDAVLHHWFRQWSTEVLLVRPTDYRGNKRVRERPFMIFEYIAP